MNKPLTCQQFEDLLSDPGLSAADLLDSARSGMMEAPNGPDWTCSACGNHEGFTTLRHDRGDEPPEYDLRCDVCESIETAESPLEALQMSLRHVQAVSRENLELRKIWWVLHLAGHRDPEGKTPAITALYGDDGEMCCSLCGADFKRLPVDLLGERIRIFNEHYAKGT